MALTDRELATVDYLAAAAVCFQGLPECHSSDLAEFEGAIHVCQNIVMARAAVRAHPDYFHASKKFAEK